MRKSTDPAAGVTYVGPRAFLIAFGLLCGLFLALVLGLDRLTDRQSATLADSVSAPTTMPAAEPPQSSASTASATVTPSAVPVLEGAQPAAHAAVARAIPITVTPAQSVPATSPVLSIPTTSSAAVDRSGADRATLAASAERAARLPNLVRATPGAAVTPLKTSGASNTLASVRHVAVAATPIKARAMNPVTAPIRLVSNVRPQRPAVPRVAQRLSRMLPPARKSSQSTARERYQRSEQRPAAPLKSAVPKQRVTLSGGRTGQMTAPAMRQLLVPFNAGVARFTSVAPASSDALTPGRPAANSLIVTPLHAQAARPAAKP